MRGDLLLIRTACPSLTDGRTWTYQYDDAGNIVYKREYAYTTGELGTPVSVSYRQFTDADWGDLMTVYNGTQITYDEVGNPLNDGLRGHQ